MFLLPEFVENGLLFPCFLNAALMLREKGGCMFPGQNPGDAPKRNDRQGGSQDELGYE